MARYHFERLSPQDASFLYWETPGMHMHVGGLFTIDDSGFTIEDVYEHTRRRLDHVPRFRQKLMFVPYEMGRPVWVDDDEFDIQYHVRHTGVPRPGGSEELLNLVGRIMSRPLDRSRPMWEMWLVDLHDDRRALIHKTHHCMVDGMSGMDISSVLLDLTPEAEMGAPSAWEPRPAPSRAQLLRDTMFARTFRPEEMVRSVRAATRAPRRRLEQVSEVGRGVASFGRTPFEPAPVTSLTGTPGPHRRIDTVKVDLQAVKDMKNVVGATVNDVILSLVAGGLRHLLQSRGEDVHDLVMRAAVPVSVRSDAEKGVMGNRVAQVMADLPVGVADPVQRVRLVKGDMDGIKESNEALGADTIMQLADFAPPTLLSLAGRIVARQWVMNLIVTNVPGPQFPLYYRGGRIREFVPVVPLVGNTLVGVGVISYDGTLEFGLTADWEEVDDLDVFSEGILKAAAELGEALIPT